MMHQTSLAQYCSLPGVFILFHLSAANGILKYSYSAVENMKNSLLRSIASASYFIMKLFCVKLNRYDYERYIVSDENEKLLYKVV